MYKLLYTGKVYIYIYIYIYNIYIYSFIWIFELGLAKKINSLYYLAI